MCENKIVLSLTTKTINNITMELHEIVSKLTGPINGVGESSQDKRHLENIKSFIELHEKMTERLVVISRDKDVFEASVKKIGLKAHEHLNYVREILKSAEAPF